MCIYIANINAHMENTQENIPGLHNCTFTRSHCIALKIGEFFGYANFYINTAVKRREKDNTSVGNQQGVPNDKIPVTLQLIWK